MAAPTSGSKMRTFVGFLNGLDIRIKYSATAKLINIYPTDYQPRTRPRQLCNKPLAAALTGRSLVGVVL
jgi:hypothetical protein